MAWICSCGQRNTLSGLPCLACDRMEPAAAVDSEVMGEPAPPAVAQPPAPPGQGANEVATDPIDESFPRRRPGRRFRDDPDALVVEEENAASTDLSAPTESPAQPDPQPTSGIVPPPPPPPTVAPHFDHDWAQWRQSVKPVEVTPDDEAVGQALINPLAFDEENAEAADEETAEAALPPVQAVDDDEEAEDQESPAQVAAPSEPEPVTTPTLTPAPHPPDTVGDERDLVLPGRLPAAQRSAPQSPHVMSVRAVAGLNDPTKPTWSTLPNRVAPTIVEAGPERVKVPALQDIFSSNVSPEAPGPLAISAGQGSPENGSAKSQGARPAQRRPDNRTFANTAEGLMQRLSAGLQNHSRLVMIAGVLLAILVASSLWGGLLKEVFAAPGALSGLDQPRLEQPAKGGLLAAAGFLTSG